MTKNLNELRGALENLEYQKKKHAKLANELSSKREQKEKAKKILEKENRDVEKIAGISFAAFMATLLNNRSEKIEKEELEALEAKHMYDAIAYEVEALVEEINVLGSQIAKEGSIKLAYQEAYEKKKKELSAQSVALWEKIRLLDINLGEKSLELKEIKEAEIACSQTLRSVGVAKKELADARAFGAWDMMGGGLLTTMAKRDHMDKAQRAINDVNYKLKRLKKELSDINESVHLEIKIDDYLSFADYFFDGFFVDMMVQNKISESQSKVENLKKDMEAMRKYLQNMRSEAEFETSRLKTEMDQVILAAY